MGLTHKLDKRRPPSTLSDSGLYFDDMLLHRLYDVKLRDPSKVRGWSREDLVNYHALILDEMQRRGLPHRDRDDALDHDTERWRTEAVKALPFDADLPKTPDWVLAFAEVLRQLAGDKVLEVGCGLGDAAAILARAWFDVTACDIDPDRVEEARQRYPQVEFHVADVLDLPYPDNSFDTVFCMHVLEHVGDDETALAEMFRVCRLRCIAVIPIGPRLEKTHVHEYGVEDAARLASVVNGRYKLFPTGKYLQKLDAIIVADKPADWSPTAKTRFIKPNKPFHRLFEPEDVQGLGWDSMSVEVKWDGVRVQLHKHGPVVKILTEDKGIDRSDRLPLQVKEALALPDGIYDGEAVAILEGKPLHRTEVTSYLNSRQPSGLGDHIHIILFDVMEHEGRDLTGYPLINRIRTLQSLPSTDHIRPQTYSEDVDKPAEAYIVEASQAVKAIEKIMSNPLSEGAMVKDLASRYETETNQNRGWAKIKKLYEIDVVVLDREETKQGAYVYIGGIEVSEDYWKHLPEDSRARLNDTPYMVIGRTFATGLKARPGDVLRASVLEVRRIETDSPEHPVYHWLLARPLELVPEKDRSDTVAVLDRIARLRKPTAEVEKHHFKPPDEADEPEG